MNDRRRWVKMVDVAREAAVATITVSRALSGSGRVSPEKRERILEAVSKLDYVPDERAGGLSSKTTRTVGAVVSTVTESIFGRTIDGLSQVLRDEGYQLLVGSTQYSKESETDFVRSLLARRPDGLVLTESVHSAALEKMLAKAGIPVVEVWELPEVSPHHAVGFSNREAAFAATKHLVDRGFRQIGFIGNSRGSDVRVQQRLKGYRECLSGCGLSAERMMEVCERDLAGVARGAHDLSRLLERWPDLDAVFCMNDIIAFGAMCEAERQGRSVPDRMGIVGFGDLDIAGEAGAGLTTVRCRGLEIGRKAGQVILENLREGSARRCVVDTGFEIVSRRTS